MRQQRNLEPLFPAVISAARRAGDAIMAIYTADEGIAVARKADLSPLTAADLAAHRCLAEDLAKLLPDVPVVSEEDDDSIAHRTADGEFWLIDPLDGTKEFLARNGEFTVNIALIQHGAPVLGVVYAPALDAMYWGGPTLGAFRMSNDATVPIRVASPAEAAPTCRVVASKSHLNDATRAFVERLGQTTLVQAGSSLKFCKVAEGAADLYPRLAPTCEWDTAAAQAVLEGAGGTVVDLAKMPLSYGKPDVLNPSFIAASSPTVIPA